MPASAQSTDILILQFTPNIYASGGHSTATASAAAAAAAAAVHAAAAHAAAYDVDQEGPSRRYGIQTIPNRIETCVHNNQSQQAMCALPYHFQLQLLKAAPLLPWRSSGGALYVVDDLKIKLWIRCVLLEPGVHTIILYAQALFSERVHMYIIPEYT